ncbi:NAD(P)-binding protein [Emcibacter sp.]|uniref:NAD(P)-binding protein n=1 Tax=Emcibacter sp. TaxID=1979954 RepID=UPI002AA96116|nr:NAD(P)-binding protein [Emcibacter sp.]
MSKKDLSGISRRDFMGGIALSLAAGTALSPLECLALAETSAPRTTASGALPYPPSLTGLRGSHAGSFEVAHALAWDGQSWPDPDRLADDPYDLVVVGGGLSGLASAYLFRKQQPDARILILDNHDDFGGHAKRNEFSVQGKQLIGYGGSQSIDGPANFSPEALQILKDLGVEVKKFYDYYDQDYFHKRKMVRGTFFDRAHFGESRLADNIETAGESTIDRLVESYPLSDAGREALIRLWHAEEDYLEDMSVQEKITYLRGLSYDDFLRKHAGMPEEVVETLRNQGIGLWGLGFDALSALEGYRLEMPGFEGMNLNPDLVPSPYEWNEPYIFHFPDGNASLARLLVRKLIPDIAPGESMEDIVTTDFDYGRLDEKNSPIRLRLLSTAVKVVHTGDREAVDVTYVRHGQVEKVRGRHVIMACYNNILPHVCPEIPEDQKEALNFPQKVPLTYINVALSNWQAVKKAGYHHLTCPHGFFHNMSLDFPVSMGEYAYAQETTEPVILHVLHTPVHQNLGLPALEQHRLGRHDIYNMTFADYETRLIAQLEEMFGPYGFDAAHDISAITVNRWPHGYAYEYNELWEPWGWVDKTEDGPHVLGRRQLGRISIANTDSQSLAYVNGAFDSAHRAVSEQLG